MCQKVKQTSIKDRKTQQKRAHGVYIYMCVWVWGNLTPTLINFSYHVCQEEKKNRKRTGEERRERGQGRGLGRGQA